MIVAVMLSPETADNTLLSIALDAIFSIGEIAIGSAVGFVFGIFAFHYQQKRMIEVDRKKQDTESNEAVKRLQQSAALNIEAIAIIKNLFQEKFVKEIELVTIDIEKYHSSSIRLSDEMILRDMKERASKLNEFFVLCPSVAVSPFPDSREYQYSLKSIPELGLIAFRAENMLVQLNRLINKRNQLIEAYAASGGNRADDDKYIFYMSLISDAGGGMVTLFDDCLAMIKIVFDQCDHYLDFNLEQPRTTRYSIAPNALKAMPEPGRFPSLEEQLTRFD